MAYEVVQKIKVEDGDKVRYEEQGRALVIERLTPDPEPPKPRERDVTAECLTELVKSKTSGGHYVAIIHDGKTVFALGVDEKSKVIPFQSNRSGRYHINHVEGATVSFKVMRRA